MFDKDEHNRPETTVDSLAKLKPAFRKDGTITAGNAPGLNSAGAAMVVADAGWAEKNGLRPMARLGRIEWSELGVVRRTTRIPYEQWPGHYGDSDPDDAA